MNRLGNASLRVMASVAAIAQRGEPVTVRGVAAEAGMSTRRTQFVLAKLTRGGLVCHVPKKSGTIRPLYSMTLYTEVLRGQTR